MPDDWLTPAGFLPNTKPEVREALKVLYKEGWGIRKQGHGYRVYCPCSRASGGRSFPVPGTPPNPGNVVRRLLQNREHCPDSHELIK